MTKQAFTLNQFPVPRQIHLLVVETAVIGLFMISGPRLFASASLPVSHAVSIAMLGQQKIDPATVMGHQKCGECHKSELAAWNRSSHANKAFQMLMNNPNAQKFAQSLGISADKLTTDSVCTTCHGTQQLVDGQIKPLGGNSCEACHGGAGGEGGWFAIHSAYGAEGTTRDQETQDHYRTRIADCAKAGMNRSANVYALAKNCYQCHTVPKEEVVNKGGHPMGDSKFEFVEWAHGEVRHNFQLNQKKNADAPSLWTDPKWNGPGRDAQGRKRLMYVVGQLVDLEVSLRNRANATQRGGFANAAAGRIAAAQRTLGRIDKAVAIQEVKAALAASKPANRARLRKISEDDKRFFDGIADAVGNAAQAISETRDGSKMGAIDKLLPKTEKGAAFQG